MVQQNKYEQLLSLENDDDKLFQIYKDYIFDQICECNYDNCHKIYERAIRYFSNKNREYVYELIMAEVKQYFFYEQKQDEGFDVFLTGITLLDDITNRLLFYRAIYQLYYELPISKDMTEPYFSILNEIMDAYQNNNIDKFTEITIVKLDTNKPLSPNEITILLRLKNNIKDKLE